jgi:hypothetical protein
MQLGEFFTKGYWSCSPIGFSASLALFHHRINSAYRPDESGVPVEKFGRPVGFSASLALFHHRINSAYRPDESGVPVEKFGSSVVAGVGNSDSPQPNRNSASREWDGIPGGGG